MDKWFNYLDGKLLLIKSKASYCIVKEFYDVYLNLSFYVLCILKGYLCIYALWHQNEYWMSKSENQKKIFCRNYDFIFS